MTDIRTESVWVLYGSQTGNSEQAAKDFCEQIEEKFTPSYFESLKVDPVKVETNCMQLDDFLEYEHSAFTKTMIIFVSSYGVGQAPMGSYKFRSFAEELLAQTKSGDLGSTFLKGISYAVCGLGDSSYTTYLQNPTTIDNAMTAVGATKLLDLGKADAKQIGETSQANKIIKWKEDLLAPLAKSLAAKPSEELDLEEVQKSAIDIVCKIDPDYVPPGGRKGGAIPMPLMVLALIALLAALVMSGVIELPK